MNIIQQPDALSLSRNLKPLVIGSSEPVSFEFKKGEDTLLSQRYEPGDNQRIEIDLREIIHAQLSCDLKQSGESYEQTNLAADFTAIIDGSRISFRVVKAGVDRLADTPTNFLKQNFLTWQPNVKRVTYSSPEFLTYYAVEDSTVKLKAVFTDSNETITFSVLESGKAWTMNLQYANVVKSLNGRFPAYYDVWVENASGQRMTYIQRYQAETAKSIHEDWVLFENSLGGIDTFRAYGTESINNQHTHNIAELDEEYVEYRVDTERLHTKNTGYLTPEESRWLVDFFPAGKKYIYLGDYLRSIVVTESEVQRDNKLVPTSYSFTYKYADARPLLNLPRTDEPADMLEIEIPEVGNFTIPPRLAEVPRLPLSEGDLFPVQNPYSETWSTTTTGALASVIGQILSAAAGDGGGIGHSHSNIDLLNKLSYTLGYLLVNSEKIKAGYADEAGKVKDGVYIHKDQPDETGYLISFLAGAIFGKNGYASGMAGFGAKIDENGNAEVESLTSRRYIEAPEFRFNSIEIFLGDKWRAPGGGLIDTVDVESKTCTLKLEDGQIGAVAVGDICMGIFHSLTSSDNATEDTDDSRGNRTFAGFCTVYFTITEVMGDKNEQFKYQIRPVSDSWKYSFDPFEQMKFVAYGSFTREDRQTSVYETRTYTRYLWHQNTWEIGKGNIAKQSGDLSNLNVFGLNMEGYSEYTTDVYFTGKIMQVKPDGTPVRTANDRGSWEDLVKEEGKKLCDYYDRVSHDGCLWLCVNEAGTDAEPSADSVDWLLQVDKGTDGTSFNLLGEKGSIEELPSEDNHPNDAWMVDGNLYVWNGTKWVSAGSIQGPAGASISNLGGWYSGLNVPYLGIVRMGWGSWMCRLKEGTQNPPLWTWTDSAGNRLIFAEDGQTFGYLLTGEVNSDEYTLVASDGEQGLEGVPGQDGAPGAPGQDGRTYYTWIRYADDEQGSGISDDPTGKAYIGFAYNRESPLESNNPEDYKWSDIKGTDGVPGEPGKDGKTLYTWIAYSDNPDGSDMYQQPNEHTLYIGIAVNKETDVEGTDPSEYTWSRFKGETGERGLQGLQGEQGEQGIPGEPGKDGADGRTTYFHIKYSANADGTGMTETPSAYIGTYVDFTAEDSADPADYTWSRFRGFDGEQGIPGTNGVDGKTYYLHIKYSDDGGTTFTGNNGEDSGAYIGVLTDMTEQDSTNPSDYKWSLIKGEQGASVYNLGGWYSGLNVPYLGIVRMGWGSWMCLQVTGTDNPPLWRWTDEEGNPLLFCSPGETTYGYLLTGEENNTEYTLLSRDGTDGLEGVPGKDGVPGADGKDGQDGKTYYTWIRYADTAEGIGMSDDPAGKKYIGLAYNRESPLEGNNPADYLWSLIKGEDGTDGVPGAPGADGKTYYTWIAYSDNADGSGMYQTPTSETRYIGIAVNKETAVESTDPSDYVWSKFRGDDGTGITSVDVEYALSSSRTSAPTSGWNTTAPTVTAGKYLWSRTKVTYTGGQYVYSGTACISGADGQDGADGKDGKGIASVTEQYYLSTSNTSLTGGSWSGTPPSNASGGYVWTRSLITYTDGTSNYTAALCVTGPKGDSLEILGRWYTGLSVPKNGVVTMGPSSYIAKSATTNPPLWTWTDKNGNRLMFKDPGSSTFYYLLTGEENTAQYNDFGSVISKGEDGADGKDGKGIQGITNYYLASSSSSGVTTSTSGWQTAVQTTTATKRYLWNYERITYTDGTTVNTTPAIIGMYAADGADGTDGRGIRSVREQYGVSSKQGVQPSSWQDTMPTLSATNKYLWNRETTTYTDGSTDTRTHIIAVYGDKGDQGVPGTPGADGKPGQDGQDGLPGCIIRRAEWAAGIEWRNDEQLTSGTRYLDVALARDDSTATGYRAFKCLKTHVSTDSTSPLLSGGTTYWEEFGLNATALFTSLIIAKNAHLTFMQGNRLVILNEDGSVAAGFVGSGIPLWVGGQDAETAPFRVTKEGKMYATDAYIEGELKAGKVGDFTIDRGIQNISDNPTAFIDIEKNGGRFFRVNREYSTGMCSIRADEAVALAVQTYGSSENSVGVDVVANNAGRGYAIRSYGNVLLQARESESIQIHGLRMNVRAVTASGSLKKNDDFVRFAQSGGTALTITVPSASDNVGKVYYLKNTGGTVTLTGSSFLGSDGYSATTSFRLTGTNAYMMVSDGTYWCLFYCG